MKNRLRKMDPELEQLTAGMNDMQLEAFVYLLYDMTDELRESALRDLGLIDPKKPNTNN